MTVDNINVEETVKNIFHLHTPPKCGFSSPFTKKDVSPAKGAYLLLALLWGLYRESEARKITEFSRSRINIAVNGLWKNDQGESGSGRVNWKNK